MTYYANAPPPVAPNKLLAAVQNQNNPLMRRPSKLLPADRLSRPPVGRPQVQQPQGYSQTWPENYRLHEHYPTQSSTSPSGTSPPRSRHDTLTGTDPRSNPYLSPGPRPGSSGQGQQQQPAAAPALPSFLRPGSGGHVQATPTSVPHALGHVRHSSDGVIPSNSYGSPNRYGASSPRVMVSASPPNPYIGGPTPPSNPYLETNGSSPNPYVSGSSALAPTPPSNPYLGTNGSSPNPYVSGSSNVLAPTPTPGPPRSYSPAPQSSNTTTVPLAQGPYTAYTHPQQAPTGGTPLWRSDNMTPPLEAPSNGSFYFPIPAVPPVGESFNYYNTRPSSSPAPPSMDMAYHQRSSPPRDERNLQARYQTPLPLPPGADRERPLPKLAPAPAPAPRPVYTRTPTPPQKNGTPVPVPDRTRVEAQRRAEEEAARRREQELKDLELAMQLDRELNLAEERAAAAVASTRPGMPRSW